MKVLLIDPSARRFMYTMHKGRVPRSHRYPGLGLTTVAALCPPDVEAQVRILDDEFEEIDFHDRPDLAGISLLTYSARRGYQIARQFRQRGVPVVLGGSHVTACPDEARQEAEAIVIGEAEDTWPQLLRDFQSGTMKPVYRSTNQASLQNQPMARRDLLRPQNYITVNTIQASRGCPFNCEFCSIAALFGHKTRCRPVEEVIAEIKTFAGRYFVFNDDNLGQEHEYYKSLFTQLIPLQKKWLSNASWNIVQDTELLKLLQQSGCCGLFIGFESIQAQQGVRKTGAAANGDADRRLLYTEVVRKLHRSGIAVMGAFIFGFDNDNERVFARTLEFARQSRLDAAQINLLVPYPGTPLYARLKQEGRLCEQDWNWYRSWHVCFEPKQMSRQVLQEKYLWFRRKFNSYPRIARRSLDAMVRCSPRIAALCLGVNLGSKRDMRYIPKQVYSA
jgi:radical SAM superfamily enzyme YgiQ (UPF0313 family)